MWDESLNIYIRSFIVGIDLSINTVANLDGLLLTSNSKSLLITGLGYSLRLVTLSFNSYSESSDENTKL